MTALCLVLVFSFDGGGPARSHTWGVFQRGADVACISWMPAGRYLRGPGRNWTHKETLAHARARGYRVQCWQFYAPGWVYEAALRRKQWLEAGGAPYGFLTSNCIWAVSGVVGPLNTGAAYGERASARVARFLWQRAWQVR